MKNIYELELIEAMKLLTEEGFKCYIRKGKSFGWIITPNDSVIYIEHYYYGGWKCSFEYVPSVGLGGGCSCSDEAFGAITKNEILYQEEEGLKFARRLKATLYKSSKDFFDRYYSKAYHSKDDIEKITSEVMA